MFLHMDLALWIHIETNDKTAKKRAHFESDVRVYGWLSKNIPTFAIDKFIA